MKNKIAHLALLMVITSPILWGAPVPQGKVQKTAGPHYTGATYGGDSVKLENAGMRLVVYKRSTGWGWVEISNSAGQLIAVLDHFGEVDPVLTGRSFPLRIEAQTYKLETGEYGQRLTFPVQLVWYRMNANSSSDLQKATKVFPISGLSDPALEGTVSITLDSQAPIAKLVYDLKPLTTLGLRYFRGPWLMVGADSFGASKTDGIFPGVDWLVGDEWSSGSDWFQHPDNLRMVLHPFKIAAPVMAISWQGTGIGLAWNPLEEVMPGRRYLQPVYASPNSLDRVNNHLMGLALPSVAWGMEENTLPIHSTQPGPAALALSPETPIHIEAELFLVHGNSLDVVVDWVKRHGLPQPPTPRYSLLEALDRIARQYNSSFWHEGKGWGKTEADAHPNPPQFLERYIREGHDRETAQSLAAKLAWAHQQIASGAVKLGPPPGGTGALSQGSKEEQLARGRELMSYQLPNGAFPYDPEKRHETPVSEYSAWIYKPLGIQGDTALDLTVEPAIDLLLLADSTGEQTFRTAARKALDYCLTLQRPEGGDWWETPLHSPNMRAAGLAAIAYYLGYQAFHEPRYRERAIYWMRAMLPFTHLWQPVEVTEAYNTKSCFNTSGWYLADWVNRDVQWQVLRIFALADHLGIDWGKIDPGIDWHLFQKGVTIAALRWMLDHQDANHQAPPSRSDAPRVAQGLLDTCFYDRFDCVQGEYGGPLILPDPIAVNLEAVLGWK